MVCDLPYEYKLVIETPILSPCPSCVYAYRETLTREYGDIARHLDRAFPRICGKPAIFPTTVYGALKRALNVPPHKSFKGIFIIFCNKVSVYTYQIKTKNGKPTLVNVEICTEGVLKSSVRLEELEELRHRDHLRLEIGWRRSRGFGSVRVLLSEQ